MRPNSKFSNMFQRMSIERERLNAAQQRGSVRLKPLTATEQEQQRSERAAWASRERTGEDPYATVPRSRQATIEKQRGTPGAINLARAGGYQPAAVENMKLRMRRG